MSPPIYGQTVDSGSTNISNKQIRSFCTWDFILVARFVRETLPFYGHTVDSGLTNISKKQIRSFCIRDFILVHYPDPG